MSVQSWQIGCPKCGWSNSGAEKRCTKCGQPLRTAPGLLVAGESSAQVVAPKAPPRRVVQPGGFFPRLIAVIIDAFIVSVILVPIFYLWLGTKGAVHLDPGAQANPFVEQLRSLGGSAFADYTPDQLLSVLGFGIGTEIFVLFYFVGTWTILGGSPGQLVMSLRVVDKSAQTIGFGRALMRYIWKGMFGWLSPVSALMVALGKEKRAIHDLLAGTYVIQFLDETVAQGDPALPPAATGTPPPAPPAAAPTPPGGAVVAAVAATQAAPAAPATAPAAPAAPATALPTPAAAAAPPEPAASPLAATSSSFERYAPASVSPSPEATAPAAVAAPAPSPRPAVTAPPIAAPAQLPPPFVPAPLPPPFAPAPQPPAFAPRPATASVPDRPAASGAEPAPAQAAAAPPAPTGLYEPPPMELPTLPPPTPAPASEPPTPGPSAPAPSNPVEAGIRRPMGEPSLTPYPSPFAPLPPVVRPPSPAPLAASDPQGE